MASLYGIYNNTTYINNKIIAICITDIAFVYVYIYIYICIYGIIIIHGKHKVIVYIRIQ